MIKNLLIVLLLVSVYPIGAQQNPGVSGKVTNVQGEPMPGVNVQIKGTTNGTVTDAKGEFAIATNSGVLIFSFIGFESQEITIGTQSVINVQMIDDLKTLSEVVVVGYGTQQKKNVTSSVVVVDESAIKERPMLSAAEALQGKAAGVQVVSASGKPGGDISVYIRGSSSVGASAQPLYVVDGVQTTDIRGLNPSDIATMTVLKDAASTAIYGILGGNGVVIITTKRSKEGKSSIQFGTYYGFQNLRKPISTLNTDQYRTLMDEVLGAGTVDPTIKTYTNWNDLVFGTGAIQNYQLSFSGSTEKSHYLLSGSYLKNDGLVKPANFNRYSIRFNFDNQMNKWLKVGTNLNVLGINTNDTPDNLSSGRGGVIMSALNTPPFLTIYDPTNPTQFAPNPFQSSWDNPYAYMFGPKQATVDNRLFGNLWAEAKFLKLFTFKTTLNADIKSHQNDYYLDPFRTNSGRSNHGLASSDKLNSTFWMSESLLTYANAIGNSNISVLAGSTVAGFTANESYIAGSHMPSNTSVTTVNAANLLNLATTGTTIEQWTLSSFFGRVNYDYNGKYLLSASVRRDGSSKLAHPWITNPSFSAGWRLSSEPFMEQLKLINNLMIRASAGRTGNSNGVPNYAQYGLITYTRVPNAAEPAATQTTYGNPDLRWELTTQYDVGTDVSILNSRVTFTADAYLKKTDDLIFPVPLPSSLPIQSILTNAGAMENKGLEFTVSTVNVQKQDFSWNSSFNISFNRNKLTRLDYTPVYYDGLIYSTNENVSIIKAGLPLGSFYGYIAKGVDPATGDMRYLDHNGNTSGESTITPGDRRVIGNGQPNFIFGFSNTMTFKQFNLNFFFQGSQGNSIYNSTRVDLEGMFDSKNQSTVVLNRWTPSNTNTNIPRAINNGDLYNVHNSSRFVEDGSYVRLKAITLTYNFKPEWLSKIKLNKFSIYATGQNLLTFTKYTGFDPEVNAFGTTSQVGSGPSAPSYSTSNAVLGVDYGTYPQARTIIFGLNLEF